MKKILSILTVCAFTAGAYAQTMVSTSPSNKNVLLEDLTGIFCGYCPDGAKRADDIKATVPDRVVIIGNHAGSYANPGNPAQAQYDLRTTEGSQINGLSDPSGYPAGNINRKVTQYSMKPGKTAMSRGSWGTVSAEVLQEPSPLNLAVDAYYRPGTQKIEINIEGYYTANGNGSDYVTVAVLQDNIDTYQSGASGYPARVQPSGLYRQMDVLRGYLSGILGDEIKTTTTGTLWSKNYSYDVVKVGPDIEPKIEDMKIAVWVNEEGVSFSEVITAVESPTVQARAVGINEATTLEGLQIYPNPFVSNATIEFNLNAEENIAINVFDVTGKLVQNFPNTVYSVGNHKINVDGQNLEGGLYYVNIVAESGIVTRKLVLNR